jgi:hypothetical protein
MQESRQQRIGLKKQQKAAPAMKTRLYPGKYKIFGY